MDVQHIPVSLIRQGDRPLRGTQAQLRQLACSILEIGLLAPLIVRVAPDWRPPEPMVFDLLAGHRRFRAIVDYLPSTTAPCVIVEPEDLRAELVTIDENILQQRLGPAREARETARHKEIYEILNPATRQYVAGGHGRHGATDKMSFAADMAEKTNRSAKTIQRAASRGERLASDANRIVDTSLDTGRELDALVKLDVPTRENLIKRAEKGETVSARKGALLDLPVNGAGAPVFRSNAGPVLGDASFRRLIETARSTAEAHLAQLAEDGPQWMRDIARGAMQYFADGLRLDEDELRIEIECFGRNMAAFAFRKFEKLNGSKSLKLSQIEEKPQSV